MPGFMPGIHALLLESYSKGVDGRNKPGHDVAITVKMSGRFGLLSLNHRFTLVRQRRDPGPAFGDGDGLTHLNEELLVGVVMHPAPALVKIEVMIAPPLGEVAP